MAVGTTDTWAASRDDIINRALANVGAVGPGVDAAGIIRTDAAARLDSIVKELDAEGAFLWRTTRLTVATTASQGYVTLSATAFDVDEPVSFLKAGGTARVPLTPMSADEYMALPDRTVEAETPSRYYIEKALSSGRTALTMYLYPEPSDTGDTVEYRAQVRAKDFNTGATNPDFPSGWHNALVNRLSADLAPSYGQAALVRTFMQLWEDQKARLLGSDNEKQGIQFVPFGGWG